MQYEKANEVLYPYKRMRAVSKKLDKRLVIEDRLVRAKAST